MKLTEQQLKIVEQAVQNNVPKVPKASQSYKAAQNNQEFQKAQNIIMQQPLVPADKMKQFTTGLAVLTNPKALNGLYKKTGVYGKGGDKGISTLVSTGMQIFTKTLGNASAAMTVAQGDAVKKEMANSPDEMNEQTANENSEFLSLVNKAQRNAASYLIGNKISKKDVSDAAIDAPQTAHAEDPFKIAENKLRLEIRKKVKKIINGAK